MKLPTWNGSDKEYYKVLEDALEKSWTGVIVANRQGKAVYCNEAYHPVSGYTLEMLETSTMYDWKATSQENVSSSIAAFEQEKEVYLEQKSLITGKRCLIKSFPVYDENNEVKYAVSNMLDITELIELQAELDREKLALSHQQEEIERLLNLIGGKTDAEIIYKSRIMERLMEVVRLISKSDATILITGESGTGKDLFAREIHRNSDRADKPYTAINCSAIPENLLESELFGYEAGAFTGGSSKGKKGLLETANGGTVFLDEIGDLPLALQAKLLRTLQNKEILPLGARNPVEINVRFVAATNLNLAEEVKKKNFREDLYYRLSVVPIHVPPLRNRAEDIPLLTHYFVKYYNMKYSRNKAVTEDAIQMLSTQHFPGNVRQLKNLLERAYLVTTSSVLDAAFLKRLYDEQDENPENVDPRYPAVGAEAAAGGADALRGGMRSGWNTPTHSEDHSASTAFSDAITLPEVTQDKTLQEMLEEYEEKILREYKKRFRSTYKMAAVLGTNQSTISRKLHKYNIE